MDSEEGEDRISKLEEKEDILDLKSDKPKAVLWES